MKLDSSKHAEQGRIRRSDGVGVGHKRLTCVVLTVAGLSGLIPLNGLAQTAPQKPPAPAIQAVDLDNAQAVNRDMAVLMAKQALPDGVNHGVQFVSPVTPDRNAVAEVKADKGWYDRNSEGIKMLLGEGNKYLIQAGISLFLGLLFGGAFGWPGDRK
jgi:hypothetical protein